MIRDTPTPGQESVWDYPRPPGIEAELRLVEVIFNGETIVESRRALRILETSHPPDIYVPFEDVANGILHSNPQQTVCEWKGTAAYWDVRVRGRAAPGAAWSYPHPHPGYEILADYVSFYPGRMEACYLGSELVRPQPGQFYGGWITSDIVGPFKGSPGSRGW